MGIEGWTSGPPAFSPVLSLQSTLISSSPVREVIWKPPSQAIGKWFTRDVSSPLSFFNVTWHQRPHYGKHWTWTWLFCWQYPAVDQTITRADPSDRELLGVADRGLKGGPIHIPWTEAGLIKDPRWHLGMCIEVRAFTVRLNTTHDIRQKSDASDHQQWSLFSRVKGPRHLCRHADPEWLRLQQEGAASPTCFLSILTGVSARLPHTSCWATWHSQTSPGFQNEVKIFEVSEIWGSPTTTESWRGRGDDLVGLSSSAALSSSSGHTVLGPSYWCFVLSLTAF